jgi:hypothetical protein
LTAIIGFAIGLACGALLCWIALALSHRPAAPRS